MLILVALSIDVQLRVLLSLVCDAIFLLVCDDVMVC